MSASTYLVSAVVMGALVIGVTLLVRRGGQWRQYTVREGDRREQFRSLASDASVWKLGYLVLTILGIVVTIYALANGNAALFVVSLGAGFAGFIAISIYVLATAKGHPHSHAVGEAVAAMGALGLLTVVGWLLFTAGA
jgi:pheromone shutdown protein TraB